jgi:hypothetical protein
MKTGAISTLRYDRVVGACLVVHPLPACSLPSVASVTDALAPGWRYRLSSHGQMLTTQERDAGRNRPTGRWKVSPMNDGTILTPRYGTVVGACPTIPPSPSCWQNIVVLRSP